MSDDPQQSENPFASDPSDAQVSPGGAQQDFANRPTPTKEECNMAMLAHLLGALLGFLGPLIIWISKKDESEFIDDQGKEAVNFHLTLLIGYAVTTILYMILAFVTCGVGAFLPLPLIVTIFQLIYGIMACLEATKGVWYRYPMNIRMIT